MTERLFSTYQIAKLLGTTLGAVNKWMDEGDLKFSRHPDGTVHITESNLIDFLTEQGIDLGEVLSKAGYTKVEATNEKDDDTAPPELNEKPNTEVEDPHPSENIEDPASHQVIETPERGDVIEDPHPSEPQRPLPDDPTPSPQSVPIDQPSEEPPPSPSQVARQEISAEQVCDAILSDAVKRRAQSVHLTPMADRLGLQLRIDGVLQAEASFDENLTGDRRQEIAELLLKSAVSDIDPEALTVPINDAEFTRTIDGRELTLTLSALPTTGGVRFVIRTPPAPADMGILGLDDSDQNRLEKLLRSDGLFVVAAKRRSGRDQVIRTLIEASGADRADTIAIARHSTSEIDNAAQVRVDPQTGLTYSAAAAALEHQDADTIVLAELRDPNTALDAFEAAHDGALVIAGSNASSASGVIGELSDMGVEAWPMGRSLRAVIERASVKTLCPECRKQGDDSSWTPQGCDICGQTGWAGNSILTGIVFIEGQLAELVRTGAPNREIGQAIGQSARSSLANSVKQAVTEGMITPDQAASILNRQTL